MEESLQLIHKLITPLVIWLPRMVMIFSIMPIFRSEIVGGMIVRNGMAMGALIYLLPVIHDTGSLINDLGDGIYLLFLKEVALGGVIGFTLVLPFWIVEAVGNLIDNQRGASNAGFDDLTQNETTGMGKFFIHIMFVLFFITGGYLNFLAWIYDSYRIWPVDTLFPSVSPDLPIIALGLVDNMMRTVVLLASPVLLCMFVAEFGLGLVSRFAPQLNVFIVAVPIKAGVAVLVLIFYLPLIAEYMRDNASVFSHLYTETERLFGQ